MTTIATYRDGDRSQLNHIRDEYNSLVDAKWKLTTERDALIAIGRSATHLIGTINRYTSRMMYIDQIRTAIVKK